MANVVVKKPILCHGCHAEKPVEEFSVKRTGERCVTCLSCRMVARAAEKRYEEKNIEKLRLKARHQQAARSLSEKASYMRNWRQESPSKARANSRNSYQRHKEERREQCRHWYRMNIEKVRDYMRRYRKVNKSYRVNGMRRHAKKKGAAGFNYTTLQHMEWRRQMWGGRCYLCGKPDADTMDHVIPLSKGGSHWPSNLRPCCRSCNSSKNNKPLVEHLKLRMVAA